MLGYLGTLTRAMDGDHSRPVELALTAPVHASAYAYWQSRRPSAGLLPSRTDLDPVDIPQLLPWINLIEVHYTEAGDVRFRHRLVGTGIVEMRDRDATGKWFDEFYDRDTLRRIRTVMDEVIELREPRIFDNDLGSVGKPHRRYRTLLLPLASDGRSVDMVIGVPHFL